MISSQDSRSYYKLSANSLGQYKLAANSPFNSFTLSSSLCSTVLAPLSRAAVMLLQSVRINASSRNKLGNVCDPRSLVTDFQKDERWRQVIWFFAWTQSTTCFIWVMCFMCVINVNLSFDGDGETAESRSKDRPGRVDTEGSLPT